MSPAQMHLALNHLPLFATLFAIVLIVIGLKWQETFLRQVGLGMLLFSAFASAPVYLSGEPAESQITGKPGVTQAQVHEHEAAALWALISAIVVGLAATILLIMQDWERDRPRLVWSI